MVLGNAEKVTILVSALEARYGALDAIRDRAQTVSIWSLGLLLAAAGWLVAGGGIPADDQLMVMAVAIAGAWWVVRHDFVGDLRDGFVAQQRVAAEIEGLLGFYSAGRYGSGSPAIYPDVWSKSGTRGGRGHFFQSIYRMLDAGLILFLLAALARSDWGRAWTSIFVRMFVR